MSDLDALSTAIKTGKRDDALALTTSHLDAGLPAGDILQAMLSGMNDIGQRFKNGEAFVPEVLIAARAMNTAMAALEPALVKAGITPGATVIIGTVQGDLHDIGKNLVAMMLKGANFRVIDLGTNVSPAAFLAAIDEHQPQVVALSALLTTTMPAMKDVIEQLRAANKTVRTMIGGAPITRDFADQIGADGYAPDAASAVDEVRRLCH